MKRLISWVLTLVMILGLLPAISLAADAESYTVMENVPSVLNTATAYDWGSGGASMGQWSKVFGGGQANDSNWPEWNKNTYAEIVVDGYNSIGALHLKNAVSTNAAVGIGINTVAGQNYTLGLWAKGTTDNPGYVLLAFTTADVKVIGDGSGTLGSDWQYFEITVPGGSNQLTLAAWNWGNNDFYIDKVTLKDSNGVDVLEGAGDFSTFAEMEKDSAVTGEMADTAMLDGNAATSWYGGAPADHWVKVFESGQPNGSWAEWDNTNYGEIAADGYRDAGSLHLKNVVGKNAAVGIGVSLDAGQNYTLGLWAKGTTDNTGYILLSFTSSDVKVLGDGSGTLDTNWKYFEATVPGNASQLTLAAWNWGNNDLYIDNITLKDSNGIDLLAGKGDFCTDYVDPNWIAVPDTIDATVAYNTYGGAPSDGWYKVFAGGAANDTWPDWNDTHYGEIVAEGNRDVGALHLKNISGTVITAGIGVDTVAGQQYTLGLWAKGTSNSGRVLALHVADPEAPIINASQEINAKSWTYYELTFTANASKQVSLAVWAWGESDIYIDNVTLKDANGVDLLKGHGDFFHYEDKPVEKPELPGIPDTLDTTRVSKAYQSYRDAWTPLFPNGVPVGTWTAWETQEQNATGYNYAEIAEAGKLDAGSLHFVRGDVYEPIGAAIDAGLTVGESYTLKAYVKGYAKTNGGGLRLLGNGDGAVAIFGDTVPNDCDWQEVTLSFTADRSTLELYVQGEAYVIDFYVDNIRILDKNGVDVLADNGDFCHYDFAEETTGLAVLSAAPERSYRWYWNSAYDTDASNKAEIAPEGCGEPGSFHLVQAGGRANDGILTLVTSQAKDLTNNQTYTLKMKVKGSFGNSEAIYVFPAYMTDPSPLHIPNKLREVLGISDITFNVPEWTELSFELPYNGGENGFTYLNFTMSKYLANSNIYIDNIQVLDPNGNDVLGGAGNFMDSGSESYPIRLVKPEVEVQNSGTMYYMGYFDNASVNVKNHEEKILFTDYIFGDRNFSVTHNGTTQTASDRNVTMNMASIKDGMPVIFSITSTKGIMEEDRNRVDEINIYDVTFSGYSNTAEALTLGQQELGFAWGDADGYSYTYTATAKGTLNVAVESGDVAVLLNGTVANAIDVNVGDSVTVTVMPNQNENGGYVATDAVINSSWEEKAPAIDSASLVLGDILNLRVKASNAEGCTLRATVGTEVQNITVVNGEYTVILPAHRLYEAVTLELLSGDAVVATETWTMTGYAAALRNEHGADNKLMALLTALENYGTYAAYYANPTGTVPAAAAVEAVTRENLAPYKLSIITKDAANLQPVASLYLDDACDIRVKLNEEAFADCKLKINGTEVTTITADGKVIGELSGLLPQQWSVLNTIEVVKGEEVLFRCSYSVLSYAYTALGKASEAQTGLNGLLKAMYLYNQAAVAYQAD